MPFYLYRCSRRPDGTAMYDLLRQVSLAGTTDGLVARFVKKYAPSHGGAFPWHATIHDLLDESGIPARGHAVVVDLKPDENVTLLQLTDVWGYSYSDWTPIAVRMETLLLDKKPLDPDAFKRRFSDESCRRRPVHEFLHLQGGTAGGSWKWGMVGMGSGVLLWPDALEFFLERIQERKGEDQGDGLRPPG